MRTQETQTCDICHQPILAGERVTRDEAETAHTACVAQWFRAQWGREDLR